MVACHHGMINCHIGMMTTTITAEVIRSRRLPQTPIPSVKARSDLSTQNIAKLFERMLAGQKVHHTSKYRLYAPLIAESIAKAYKMPSVIGHRRNDAHQSFSWFGQRGLYRLCSPERQQPDHVIKRHRRSFSADKSFLV